MDCDHTHSKAKPQTPPCMQSPKANAKIMFFYYQSLKIKVLSKQKIVLRQALWGA